MHVFYLTERDCIEIFNSLEYGSGRFWEISDDGTSYKLISKEDARVFEWTHAEANGFKEAYIKVGLWRRGELD